MFYVIGYQCQSYKPFFFVSRWEDKHAKEIATGKPFQPNLIFADGIALHQQ
jgi:hypothetical protein